MAIYDAKMHAAKNVDQFTKAQVRPGVGSVNYRGASAFGSREKFVLPFTDNQVDVAGFHYDPFRDDKPSSILWSHHLTRNSYQHFKAENVHLKKMRFEPLRAFLLGTPPPPA